jgi:putative transposase
MVKPSTEYRSGRHCVFLLHAHLIFTPKYRKRVFDGIHIDALRIIFAGVCEKFGVVLTEFNGEPDHVHLLVEFPPSVQLSTLVNSLKGVSSRLLRTQYPEIDQSCWKGVLWSRSYFAASCGGAPLSIIKQYVEQQKKPA